MKLNCTHLVRADKRELLEKSNIWEADMLLPVRPSFMSLAAYSTDVRDVALCW